MLECFIQLMLDFISHLGTYSRTYNTFYVILPKEMFEKTTKNATISLFFHL